LGTAPFERLDGRQELDGVAIGQFQQQMLDQYQVSPVVVDNKDLHGDDGRLLLSARRLF
jgi:hypothetical protein